jgi:hypothetical protein
MKIFKGIKKLTFGFQKVDPCNPRVIINEGDIIFIPVKRAYTRGTPDI